jgi:osmoprotectant transport system permease protein
MSWAALGLRIGLFAGFVCFISAPQWFSQVFEPLTHDGAPAIYDQGDLLQLAVAHVALVVGASALSAGVALLLGIAVTRAAGRTFLPVSRAMVGIGQTFPPVAVLAIAVPLVGFGLVPTLVALFAYGLLPVFENTVAGLESCPPAVLDAADGMGMNGWQRLLKVELPLAAPVVMTGVRLSVAINVGTATLGSTVAAKGLGEVIIAGLLSDNAAFVLQGGLATAAIALFLWDGLRVIEDRLLLRGRERTMALNLR